MEFFLLIVCGGGIRWVCFLLIHQVDEVVDDIFAGKGVEGVEARNNIPVNNTCTVQEMVGLPLADTKGLGHIGYAEYREVEYIVVHDARLYYCRYVVFLSQFILFFPKVSAHLRMLKYTYCVEYYHDR